MFVYLYPLDVVEQSAVLQHIFNLPCFVANITFIGSPSCTNYQSYKNELISSDK